jgi:hypothetical protein
VPASPPPRAERPGGSSGPFIRRVLYGGVTGQGCVNETFVHGGVPR